LDISIIIVNYNTYELTAQAIQSVYNTNTSYSYEIIVVDNNSSDDSIPILSNRYPNVHFIKNISNEGFSKANNQGIQVSKGRYILLLNSDTIIEEDTLETMIRYMDERPNVGASGCKVVLPTGELDKACKRGFPHPSAAFYYLSGFSKKHPENPKYNQYHLSHLDPDIEHSVDSLVGAFMMVRKETINEVGMLDETFFMYGEDIDWCYRIKEAGWKIIYNPSAYITHLKGASSKKKPLKIIYEFHRAMYIFHRKHYHPRHNFIVNWIVYIGIWSLCASKVLKNTIRTGD